ncbi:hypothetical protein B6K86_04875 [Lachnospiraceae bacterium]|nr:hypothetical protein B6K86_04875 [Lachnospiraceae bacterium]
MAFFETKGMRKPPFRKPVCPYRGDLGAEGRGCLNHSKGWNKAPRARKEENCRHVRGIGMRFVRGFPQLAHQFTHLIHKVLILCGKVS